MREKTMHRITGGLMLSVGLPALWLARWGVLWEPQYRGDLDGLERYLLHPGLYLCGAVATALGVWHLWMRSTTFGKVLRSWAEACRWERYMDDLYAAQMPAEENEAFRRTLGEDFHYLWYLLTHCAIGRHDPNSRSYNNGGEDGPRGTQCCDCGLYLSREDITRPHVPLSEEDIARMEAEMATYMTEEVVGDSDTVMVLYPDGQRRPEDAPTRH